ACNSTPSPSLPPTAAPSSATLSRQPAACRAHMQDEMRGGVNTARRRRSPPGRCAGAGGISRRSCKSHPATASFAGAPTINLVSSGYVEREFTMSGTTSIFRQSGLRGPDGRWGVSVAQSNVPYKTRLLVRYPTDPAKFNETVVVESLNDTTGGDQDPVWSEIYNEVLS